MSLHTREAFRPDIAGLRAWAVLAVVLYHFGVPGFAGGFVGVDVFFVISGFLMTRIIVNSLQGQSGKPFSVWQFYLARARRIVPALLVMCAVLLVLGWFVLPFTDYKPLGTHVLTAVLFASNIQFWREAGYFDADSHDKWLLHTWSLSVEWQFYLVLPVVLWGIWKFWPGRKSAVAVVAVMMLASLGLSVWLTANKPEAAFFLLPTRAWEMLAGGLVALWAGEGLPLAFLRRQRLLESLGFLMMAAAVVTANPAKWPGAAALLPVVGTVLVLMAQRQSSVMTATPVLQRLGDWSYSIYLWHWPIVVALVYVGWQDQIAPVIAGLAVSVFLGWMSYRWVEPLGRVGQHWRAVKAFFLFGLAVAILGAFGLTVRLMNGVPGRLSPQVEAIAAAAHDINPLRDKSHTMGGTEFKSHVYGGPNVKAIVWGDSHASTIVTAVQAAQTDPQDGVLGMSYTSCPTLFGVRQERKDLYCAKFNEWAMQQMDAVPNDVPVIIVNRSSAYLFGKQYGTYDQDPSIYFDNTFKKLGKSYSPFFDEYEDNLVASMCRIAKTRPVYMLRPLPEMPVNVPRVMARAEQFNRNLVVDMPLVDYKKRNEIVLKAQNRAANECNMKIVDPLNILCEKGICHGSREKEILFYDDNHLSEVGNKHLIKKFRDIFDK